MLFRLSTGPYVRNTNGIGANSAAMHPKSVLAHLGFSVSYICVANRGNPAPNRDRITVLHARALAATKR